VPEPAQVDPRRARSSSIGWLDRITAGNRWAKALLAFPAASAVFTIATMMYMAGFFSPTYYSDSSHPEMPVGEQASQAIFGVLIGGFNVLPAVALAVLISLTARRFAKGMPVVAVGCLAFTAACVWAVLSIATDESSTAAIGLLFLPPMLGVLLLPFAGVAVLVHVLRNRDGSK